MEPNTIEESIKGLLEAIKESPEYLEFQKQSDILKKEARTEGTCGYIQGR